MTMTLEHAMPTITPADDEHGGPAYWEHSLSMLELSGLLEVAERHADTPGVQVFIDRAVEGSDRLLGVDVVSDGQTVGAYRINRRGDVIEL